MKVAISTHYFSPHIGGIESVAESHAERLTQRGHDVKVITTNIGAGADFERKSGFTVQRYNAWNPGERLGIPYPIPSPSQFRSEIKQTLTDIDVIHVHGMNYLTSMKVIQATPAEVPIVLHQHTPFVNYPIPVRWIEKINDGIVGRWNLSRADQVFCVSQDIEQYVTQIDPDVDTEVMVNGIDTELFHPGKAEKNQFDCNEETPVFFSLSRMSQKKGMDTLLETVKQLDSQNVEVHIVVAGDGPLRDEVEHVAEEVENMEVLGRVDDDTLTRYYASSDAFIFTSKSGEAFPTLTMIESYASGTPVIASELSENPLGIEDGKDSILISPGESGELAKSIQSLANNPDRLPLMSDNARETAEKHFSLRSRIDRLESCYRSLSSR
jgi:glycosyltransferase involved in cell wall biosynthesis